MTLNIIYRLQNKEYDISQREELANLIGSIYLDSCESEATESFREEGKTTSEFILRGDRCLTISIEPEVDDEDDSEEYHVNGDTEGAFDSLNRMENENLRKLHSLCGKIASQYGASVADVESDVRYYIENLGEAIAELNEKKEKIAEEAEEIMNLKGETNDLFYELVDAYVADPAGWDEE